MPVVDPSQVAGPIAKPQIQPQPFPGARLPMGGNVVQVQGQQEAAQRAAINQNQDARANQSQDLENKRFVIAKKEADRKDRAAQFTGGVDIHAEEQKSAGLVFQMTKDWEGIQNLAKKYPQALQPGLMETVANGMTDNSTLRNMAIPKEVRTARIQMNDRYRRFVQNSIYLASGAAFQKQELDAMLDTIKPSYFDDPATMDNKRQMVEEQLQAGMLKAGAGQAAIQAALQKFRTATAPAFSAGRGVSNETPEIRLSSTQTQVPLPKGFQEDHAAWLAQHPPGTLKAGDYANFRLELAKKYDMSTAPLSGVDAYVEAYNQGRGSTVVPNPMGEMGLMQKAASGIAADKGVAGDVYAGALNFANAGGMGIPSLLAGQEGRAAMHAVDANHPKSAMAGDIAGSIAPTMALENIVGRGLTRLGAKEVGVKVGREMLANSAYGAARGYNEAEPADRGMSAIVGGALGAVAPIVGRAAVRGAKGFQTAVGGDSIERLLKEQKFEIPGERLPLPVDEVTPASYQSMTEAQLREAAANAERDLGTHQAAMAQHEAAVEQAKKGFSTEYMARQQAAQKAAAEEAARASGLQEARAAVPSALSGQKQFIEETLARTAGANREQQAKFLKEMSHYAIDPESDSALRNLAEEKFPTDPTVLEQQLRQNAPHLFEVPTMPKVEMAGPTGLDVPKPVLAMPKYQAPEGLESPDILRQRQSRINEYLATPNIPSEGTIPAVNLTTLQRAGLGRLEESATGLPFVRGARQAVDESYTKRKVAEALSTAGIPLPQAESGMELFDAGYKALGEKYEKLGPMIKGNITQNFSNSIAALRASALGPKPSAERRAAWNEVETALQTFQRDGKFDKTSFRELSDRLGQIHDTYSDATGDLVQQDVARAAKQAKDRLVDLLAENNPAAAAAYRPLNKAYAQFSQLQKATKYKSSRLEGSTVAPEPLYDSMYKADTSPDKMDFTRGNFPGQKAVKEELDIIGGKVPAKDSLGQSAVAGGLIGYGGFLPKVAATLAIAGYTPGTKQLLQALLRGYPEKGAAALSAIVKGDGSSKVRKALAGTLSPDAFQALVTQTLREYKSGKNEGN